MISANRASTGPTTSPWASATRTNTCAAVGKAAAGRRGRPAGAKMSVKSPQERLVFRGGTAARRWERRAARLSVRRLSAEAHDRAAGRRHRRPHAGVRVVPRRDARRPGPRWPRRKKVGQQIGERPRRSPSRKRCSIAAAGRTTGASRPWQGAREAGLRFNRRRYA